MTPPKRTAACLPGRAQGFHGGGKREGPVLSDFPDSSGGSREVFPSPAPAQQPLWAHHLPTAFCPGVLLCLDKSPSPTVQQCFYTPQGSCSVRKTKHSTLRKKAGGGCTASKQATYTACFLVSILKPGPRDTRTTTASKRRLRNPERPAWKPCFHT